MTVCTAREPCRGAPANGGAGGGGAEGPEPGQPIGRLAPQPWMTAAPTRAVMAALTADGSEVRFIGGCVRDAVARRPVQDIDIATAAPPGTVIAQLRRSGLKAVPTGIGHGTVTAVADGRPFEITTLRIDVETDGRHATVAFTNDWLADAARRDLTINAMSCTPDGAIFDYFNGLDDLAQGRVRFVGRAGERIAEDRLRILRFFRFYAHYGRPPPDPDALAACQAQAEGITDLSGERVRIELLKTLAAAEPAEVLRLMHDHGVLRFLLPEANAAGIGRLQRLAWLESRATRLDSVAPDPIRRLAALVMTADGCTAAAESVAGRLRLANQERDRLLSAVSGTLAARWPAGPEQDEVRVRRALHHRGAEAVRDRLLLDWAEDLSQPVHDRHVRTEAWIGRLKATETWQASEFPLKGRDALALGVPAGPAVGALLSEVERWWEAEDFQPDRAACLDRLRALVARRERPPFRS